MNDHNIRWCILMVPVIVLGVVMAEDGQWWGWIQVAMGSASLVEHLWRIKNAG